MKEDSQRIEGFAGVRIAIPAPTSTNEAYNQRAWAPYFHSLVSSGAIAVPVPLDTDSKTVSKLAASCAGVLLPGSPADLNPARYGAERQPQSAKPDSAREQVDQLLMDHAIEAGKPILGICYGLQSLNVWRRGSLKQHVEGHDFEREQGIAHRVCIAPASKLAAIAAQSRDETELAHDSIGVNSSHHQTADNPGQNLVVSARSAADGEIEALEWAGDRFILGVQWHPERTYDLSGFSRAIFRAFVDAAAAVNHHRVEVLK